MEERPRVLVVDDDADVLKAAGMALSRVANVQTELSPERAANRIAEKAYAALLLDMNFALGERSGKGGFDALARFQALDSALSVVLMTSYGSVNVAVEGLKRGACDFILKPWRNEALLSSVMNAVGLTIEARKEANFLTLEEVEADAIRRALAHSAGNVSGAAARLGLTRQALYRRMARHGF